MKKLIAYGLSAAMMLSASTTAFAAEMTTTPQSYKMDYGFTVRTPEVEMSETINLLTDGDLSSASVSVTVNEGGEVVSMDLPNYVVGSADGVYLNLNSILNLVASLADEYGAEDVAEQIQGSLESVGITTGWIELVPIDLSAIKLDTDSVEFQIPEMDEAFFEELAGLFSELITVEESDDAISYVINTDTVLRTAEKMDEFKANRLQFIGDYLTAIQNVIVNSKSIDVKPAIDPYIKAVAEGIAENSADVTPEAAEAVLNSMIDLYINQAVAQAKAALQEVPVADLWNAIGVKALLENMLAGNTFEFRLTMNAEGIGFTLTAGENKVLSGIVELQDNTIIINLMDQNDQNDQLAMIIEIVMEENGSSCTVKTADGTIVSQSKSEVLTDETSIKMTYDMQTDNGNETMNFGGFFNMELWENDGSLQVPEDSTSILDVIKNVVGAAMAGQASAQ